MNFAVQLCIYNRAEREILNRALDEIEELRKTTSPFTSYNIFTGPDATPDEPLVTGEGREVIDALAAIDGKVPGRFNGVPVADVLRAYLADHGIAEARKLLSRFNVDRINELPEDQHDAFRVAAEK